jgi:hypothetical protein
MTIEAEQTVTYISEDMRRAVGREQSRAVSFPVSESDIRKWAISVYYPEPPPARFWDEEAAAASPWGGIVAPEDFNPFAWMTAEPAGRSLMAAATGDLDQTEHALGIEGPGLKNVLNGGLSVEYGVPIRPGDVITSVSYLSEYKERPGSLGLMLFTSSEAVWTNQRGEVVKRTRGTFIRY